MASGKKKSIDEMNMKELAKVMEILDVSDTGVENLSDARSRIRSALNAAEKTSNWSPGEIRYFSVSEGFSTLTSLAGVHARVSFKRSEHFVIALMKAMRRQTVIA